MASNNTFEAVDTTKKFHVPKTEIPVYCAILVISDSLSKEGELWREKDKSGKLAESMLSKKPFIISSIDVLPDEIDEIQERVSELIGMEKINFILTIGGTGISRRDVTIEALRAMFEKELSGFGELFRQKTFEEKETVSIMTRATAGVADDTLICCLPGSSNAVKLGITLIESEIQHILNLRKKSE